MTTLSTEAVQKFIAFNKLNKIDGIILFDAMVIYTKNNTTNKIVSPVQILTLPNAIAVYIFEFFKEAYEQADMYSTQHHYFNCPGTSVLEISSDTDSLQVAIIPL